MASIFTVNSTKTACASAALKIGAQIASTSTKTCKIIALDVTFDGTDATKTPILVEMVRTTGASATGGSAPTPVNYDGTAVTSSMTARINDTADGSSPTVICGWLVSPTSGLAYQWPLGREIPLKVSDFVECRITTVAGSGTPNYDCTITYEE